MSILPTILASIFGAFCFLFLFWRRLKEDYSPNLIFNSGFIFIIIITVFSVLSLVSSRFVADTQIFRPSQLWFWSGVLGILVSLRISVAKFRLKTIESFEAVILGVAVWLLPLYIVSLAFSFSAKEAVLPISTAFLVFLFFYLDKKYRKFQWYKSGKVGFAGLSIAVAFFLIRIFLAYFEPNVFSIVGRIDVVISAVAAFLLAFSLYNLAEV